MPFEWGKNDCCLFVVDWLIRLGYPDFASDYRGYYNDRRTAAKRIREVKDNLVRNIPNRYFKMTTKPMAGDIALGKHGYNLGIVNGKFSYFVDGKNNCITRVDNKLCKTFWRVV